MGLFCYLDFNKALATVPYEANLKNKSLFLRCEYSPEGSILVEFS
jgi:hypothetical protein